MAQEAYDKLMEMTDSRYRLSIVAAKRAAQIKAGIPSTLSASEMPKTKNSVTIALKELTLNKGILWSIDGSLPTNEELKQNAEREQRVTREQNYTITRLGNKEEDFDDDE